MNRGTAQTVASIREFRAGLRPAFESARSLWEKLPPEDWTPEAQQAWAVIR